uniref:Uncharacterized protein n=1 Tax=Oryza nivara TaxID=4536 RepID=A0A0E0GR27_ORYNI
MPGPTCPSWCDPAKAPVVVLSISLALPTPSLMMLDPTMDRGAKSTLREVTYAGSSPHGPSGVVTALSLPSSQLLRRRSLRQSTEEGVRKKERGGDEGGE